jgi:hypothetical protein
VEHGWPLCGRTLALPWVRCQFACDLLDTVRPATACARHCELYVLLARAPVPTRNSCTSCGLTPNSDACLLSFISCGTRYELPHPDHVSGTSAIPRRVVSARRERRPRGARHPIRGASVRGHRGAAEIEPLIQMRSEDSDDDMTQTKAYSLEHHFDFDFVQIQRARSLHPFACLSSPR